MNDAPWGSRDRPWPISVGDLDNWSYFQSTLGQPWEKSDEAFQRDLNRLGTVGPPAYIGKAFHSTIEQFMMTARDNPGTSYELSDFIGIAEPEGYRVRFFTESAKRGTKLDVKFPAYTVVEQDVEIYFETPSGWVHLRGVIDGLLGNTIVDLKTKKVSSPNTPIKPEKYMDSWQWRAYLMQMGERYRRFQYHVFGAYYTVDVAAKAFERGEVANVLLMGYHPFDCWRYPAMESDLQGVAAELASYLVTIDWQPPKKRQMKIF